MIMNNTKQILLAAIMAACNMSLAEAENEFNPFEYAGMLGEDVMEDLVNMGY